MNKLLKVGLSIISVAIIFANCFVAFAEKNDITYDKEVKVINEIEEKDEFAIEKSETKGNWILDNDNWYYHKDGNFHTGWLEIDDNKYYMGPSGKMKVGWRWIDDAWYYFNEDGSMKKGWLLDNGKWYYLLEDGKMKTGWLEIDNNKYYMNTSGKMEVGWNWISDAWYYFNNDGSMKIGWLLDSGEWYYLLEDGKMKTGWLEFEEKKYFLLSNGAMAVGWISIEGVWNEFAESGEFLGTETPPFAFPKEGIDVSTWQGDNIDWNAVKNSGIEFVMIRSNFGWTGVDKRFKQNIEGAKAAGLKVGVYLYSYATNVTEASWEFDNLMRTISGYELDYPVAYDLEDPKAQGNLSVNELTDIAVTFCEKVKQAGYTPMVYGSVSWLENKLDYNRIRDYKIWVAQYNSVCQYDYDYNIWQYTSQGKVDGIDGDVDRNICYGL